MSSSLPTQTVPNLPRCWQQALRREFEQPYWFDLMSFVTQERSQHQVFPPEDDVFNSLILTPLHSVRVVILGQDPYPTPGHAHGLCFSVRPGVAIPRSLRNIFKELQTDLGLPAPQHGCLQSWATQGVLLLNSVLTVLEGSPLSHALYGWEQFTDAVLRAVNELPEKRVFILWGAQAMKKHALIDSTRHAMLTSAHPSPLSARNGFFGSRPFSKTNAILQEAGFSPINWRLEDSPALSD